jgi:hypothetical protein
LCVASPLPLLTYNRVRYGNKCDSGNRPKETLTKRKDKKMKNILLSIAISTSILAGIRSEMVHIPANPTAAAPAITLKAVDKLLPDAPVIDYVPGLERYKTAYWTNRRAV